MPKMINWVASYRFLGREMLILILLLSVWAGICTNQGMPAAQAASIPIFFHIGEWIGSGKAQLLVLPNDRVDEISVEKISQFIQAYLQVIQLLESHQGELHRPHADAEKPSLQLDIEQLALHQIESAGLTRQEYLQLLNLANADPDFSDRIAMQLQEFTLD